MMIRILTSVLCVCLLSSCTEGRGEEKGGAAIQATRVKVPAMLEIVQSEPCRFNIIGESNLSKDDVIIFKTCGERNIIAGLWSSRMGHILPLCPTME